MSEYTSGSLYTVKKKRSNPFPKHKNVSKAVSLNVGQIEWLLELSWGFGKSKVPTAYTSMACIPLRIRYTGKETLIVKLAK